MKKNIKEIVMYAPSLNTGGGTERVLVNLSNALITKGYKIIIVSNIVGTENIYNLNEYALTYNYWFGKLRSKYPRSLFFKIVNKLFGKWFLNIFLNNIVSNSNSIIISFSNSITIDCFQTKFKKKIIAFEHWPYWISNGNPKLQTKINNIYPQLRKVIVLTNHEKKVYNSIGCENVEIIPNAYSFQPSHQAILKNKIVLSVGHFNEQKRRDLLVESWMLVAEKHPDWKLQIIGEGHLKDDIIDTIKKLKLNDSIELIEPTTDIYKFYLEASIFLMSSEYEALPMVLIEAKTCGLPCVSFDIISGPNEIIRNKQDGFLVEYPNVKEMAAKVCVLIENEKTRKVFGNLAKEDALTRFSRNEIYDKWDRFLRSI